MRLEWTTVQQRWVLMLSIAMLLHWGVLLLFALDVIPQTTKNPCCSYHFHHGGDEFGYWIQTQALLSGEFEANKFPLGFPMLLVPLYWLLQPATISTFIQPVALFWSAVMFPLMQLMLAWLAHQLSGRAWVAWATAILVALLPLLAWLGFNLVWNAEMAEIIAIHFTWAQMLSDGPAAFFTVLAVALYWRTRQTSYSLPWLVLLGLTLGLLTMIRFSGALIAVVIAGAFIFERRWLQLVCLVAIAGLAFAPQALYNFVFFDGILTTGYVTLDNLPPRGLFDVSYLSDALAIIWERGSWLAVLIGGLGAGLFGWVLTYIWRQTPIGAWLIGGWLVSYLLFYSVYYYSWTGALMRFMIPTLPAVAFIMAILADRIWRWLGASRKLQTISV